MSTETPLTDAKWNLETNKGHFHDWRSVAFEMRDHARSIERRNSELTARIAELEASYADAIEKSLKEHLARRDAETALAEARKDSAWRPIETAPKDGTRVLIWSYGPGIETAIYCDRKVPPGWSAGSGCPRAPHSWMPLPATPLPEKEAR